MSGSSASDVLNFRGGPILLLLTAHEFALEDPVEHLRIELFASRLRERGVDEASCWAAGPANILAELCE